jgi:hypothetical protein
MKIKPVLFFMAFLFLANLVNAQPVTGFWEITKVMVGEEIMTPVARWTRINADHTFQSGNGWLQNSIGTWTYDERQSQYSAEDNYGIRDEYGPFNVRFDGDTMFWERIEEEMQVKVTLEKITSKPMSTADRLHGLWDLTHIVEAGRDITAMFDPDGLYYVFIRWDRIYVERNADGEQSTGYWHIHGHRPEVTFLSHRENEKPKGWTVEVSDTQLSMTGVSETNKDLELQFQRIHEFPE